ncbi:hypothetical protein PMNALOAF_4263 [Methylobacterium adhaesivum]|uniref:Uncharacterized protein n=1 Tax=Methylobacterium adhaesivum TaxID=333297 RepID=A0ABT8BL27_9HYPH|nr:hypothetical protein [Methylobacterium adhaesivum]MDN3591990.1 hypothetical protein [Methylobacterium adhaesivum]GJD32982.1 hypothetical protein PMNALOAF_4263 [Methylobacterium adhaesivum]
MQAVAAGVDFIRQTGPAAADVHVALPSSAILHYRFDRMDLGLKISNLLQDAFAREETASFGFERQEGLFSPQAFDERFQI